MRAGIRHRQPVKSSGGWPAWSFYLLAAVLLLATVPLYRRIFAALRAAPAAPVPVIVLHAPPSPVAAAAPPVHLYRYRLASDQRCYGGAVIQIRGNVYTQIGDAARPVHCVGDYADSPPR